MEKSDGNTSPYEKRLLPRDKEQRQRFDWLVKDQESLLGEYDLGKISGEELARRNARAMMMLENLAMTSHKTLLPNERYFKGTLEGEIGVMQRLPGYTGYVAYLDVDDLKAANSSHGHVGGDELLRTVAMALLDSSDTFTEKYNQTGNLIRILPAHASGDEFEVLIGGLSKEQVREFGESVLEKIMQRKLGSERLKNLPPGKAASIGFRVINGESYVDQSIEDADTAMYEAKSRGKNQIVFFEDLDKETIVRRRAEKDH